MPTTEEIAVPGVLSRWESEQFPLMVELRERTASILSTQGLDAEAARLRGCGHREGVYAPTRKLCGSTQWCPFDISFRAWRQRKWLHKYLIPGRWVHLTAPALSCRPESLRVHTRAAITGTRRLIRHLPLQIAASISATEYTVYGEDPGLTNAHVHTLALVRRRKGVPVVPFNDWYELWQRLCPDELARSIKVGPIDDMKGVLTVADYLTKDADYLDMRPHKQGFIERWSERLDNPERFVMEVQQTSRLWRFYGNLKRPDRYRKRMEWVAP